MVKTVLFDLDGTLLPLDSDALAAAYFRHLARYLAPYIPPAELAEKVMASTRAMIQDTDPDVTNLEAFWADFVTRVAHPRAVLEPVLERFYAEEFPKVGHGLSSATILAPRVVGRTLELGYEIVVATNPLFPRAAILERLRWAGVLDLPWRLVTALEDMHFCKPQPAYYREVLGCLGRSPAECLMVGNDVQEDGVAATLGMPVYMVTDFLINRTGEPVPEPSGSLAAFTGWLEQARP